MTELLPYDDADELLVDLFRRVHGNSERTYVAILSDGDNYVAVAYDVDPVDMMPLAADMVAVDPTEEGVRERARRWMLDNPKGVLGDGDEGSSLGKKLGSAALKGIKKLDEHGNQKVEDIREQQGGGQ